jgi:hypothetical protein
MKTAVDLPDELFKEVKMHAVRHGSKLKDTMAVLLRRGLDAAGEAAPTEAARIERDPVSGLPTVVCRHAASESERLTPKRIAEILIGQEVARNREASR